MTNTTKSPKELMEYRYLGRTGLQVSVLSFGAWVRPYPLLPFFQNQSYF